MISMIHILALAAFPALVILAALRDLTSYTIPNWISVALLALYPLAVVSAGLPIGAIGLALAAGGVALLAGIAMFALGWIGGGDAKLFAAATVWLGWPAAAPYVIWTALAGGGLAVLLLWSRKVAQPAARRGPAWFGRLMTPGGDVPYGLAICFGALIAYPGSTIATLAA